MNEFSNLHSFGLPKLNVTFCNPMICVFYPMGYKPVRNHFHKLFNKPLKQFISATLFQNVYFFNRIYTVLEMKGKRPCCREI